MIVGIDHVQITVPPDAVERARAFYCGVLGLREVEKPSALAGRGGFWLQAGDRQVHVGVEEGVDRHATRIHIAYAVRGLADWRARLAAARIPILEAVPIPGYERFEFRDPFGNRVEFIEAIGGTMASESGEAAMIQTVEAVYDGTVLRPDTALELEPNTRVRITVEALPPAEPAPASFLRTARSLDLRGPADWSENLDSYLYGDGDRPRG